MSGPLTLNLDRPHRDCSPRLLDYEAERATYRVEVPERFNAVLSIVDSWASEDPAAPALLSLDASGDIAGMLTAMDLATASRHAGRALLNLDVAKGDVVLVMLPRSADWYVAILGCMRIGAVPILASNVLTAPEILYRLERGHATAVITDAGGSAKIERLAPDVSTKLCIGATPRGWLDFAERCEAAGDGDTPHDPTHRDDPLLLYFTSGTVSYPKLVRHPQSFAMGHVARARFWQDLRPGDLHWNAAAELLFGQMHERACSLQVAAGQLDADATLGILSRHRVTSFSATPTLYRAVVYGDFAKYDLSALRHCTSAGEPLNPEVMRAWSEGTGGLAVYDGYGQTETTVPVANYRSVEVRPGSMGRAMPGWDIAVVDDDGAPAATGEVANLVIRYDPVRPVGLFPGYLGDPDATAAVFRAPYYFTGDRAAMDVDGYVWFEGRNDDVIKAGTRSLGPFEVESVLLEHPAVMEAAVVGRDGQHQAQIVVAVCVLAPGPYTASSELAGELHEFIKQSSAAAYKHPREIYFVDKLPKTSSGKIRRTEVREQLRAGTLSKLEPTL